MQRKNKELYELTVQLGCLKEENYQLKKEKEELTMEFQSRLKAQQARAEEDYRQLQEETGEKVRIQRREIEILQGGHERLLRKQGGVDMEELKKAAKDILGEEMGEDTQSSKEHMQQKLKQSMMFRNDKGKNGSNKEQGCL